MKTISEFFRETDGYERIRSMETVSYTHLTLPTSDLV